MGATVGTITIIGNSGRTYTVNASIPDGTGSAITWDLTGLSATTSPDQFRAPESGYIINLQLATAPTATGVQFYSNNVPIPGANVRYAAIDVDAHAGQLMGFPIRQGDLISAIEW